MNMEFEYVMDCNNFGYYKELKSRGIYVKIGEEYYPVASLDVPDEVRKRANIGITIAMNFELSE